VVAEVDPPVVVGAVEAEGLGVEGEGKGEEG